MMRQLTEDDLQSLRRMEPDIVDQLDEGVLLYLANAVLLHDPAAELTRKHLIRLVLLGLSMLPGDDVPIRMAIWRRRLK